MSIPFCDLIQIAVQNKSEQPFKSMLESTVENFYTFYVSSCGGYVAQNILLHYKDGCGELYKEIPKRDWLHCRLPTIDVCNYSNVHAW